MSQYTTGEVAKLCGITVRTVQYYDGRGILTPSALSEGGRRLYSEEDVRKCRVICFLRDIGLSIDTIGQLLSEEDPGSVTSRNKSCGMKSTSAGKSWNSWRDSGTGSDSSNISPLNPSAI